MGKEHDVKIFMSPVPSLLVYQLTQEQGQAGIFPVYLAQLGENDEVLRGKASW